jgi:tryptophanyl-tRNA synthetase
MFLFNAYKMNWKQFSSMRHFSAHEKFLGKNVENSVKIQRVLSGIQPTGSLHIGNYLGALRQWVNFQDIYENYFCVVDLHAITTPQDPDQLRKDTLQIAAVYLAAGIDPRKSTIFVQSHISAHAELAWILNCVTPINWMDRMTQFKDKSANQTENVSLGLFNYPVLMAADILLYKADLVPVGHDQLQHLELTRDIARRFNDKFCKNHHSDKPLFTSPKALLVEEGARIMSLQDGTKKMSKSDVNDFSRINLLDPPEVIQKKIKRCKTDAILGLEWNSSPSRPEVANLLSIYQGMTGKTKADITEEVKSMSWGSFKPLLADAVIDHLSPIQAKYKEIRKEEAYLEQILFEGKEKAQELAENTLQKAKNLMGIFSLRQEMFPPSKK